MTLPQTEADPFHDCVIWMEVAAMQLLPTAPPLGS